MVLCRPSCEHVFLDLDDEMPDSFDLPDLPTDRPAQAFWHPAFAAEIEAGAPSVVIRGPEPRVAWANQAAALLFELSGYEALQRRLIGRGAPSTRQLAHLLAAMKPGAPPRLERLRFAWGARVRNFTALCGRAADEAGEPVLALAFLGPEAESVSRVAHWSQETEGEPARPSLPPDCESSLSASQISPEIRDASDPVATLVSIERKRDALRLLLGGSDLGRFAWKTDASGHLSLIDDRLSSRLAMPLAVGGPKTFDQQIGDFDPTAAERLRAALETGSTWSGVELLCPVADGSVCLPLGLTAAPYFDSGRRFLGFRGFAKFDLSQLRDRVRSEPAPEILLDPAEADPAPSTGTAMLSMTDEAIAPLTSTLDPSVFDLESVLEADPSFEADLPSPHRVEETVASIVRPANVVQLWPLLSSSAPRISSPASKLAAMHDAPATAETPAPAAADDLRSNIEAAVGRSLEQRGALTSSEHQAFEEIGRALGMGPRRTPPPPGKDGAPISGNTAPAADTDLTRQAAALIEQIPVGVLVIRRKRVLFTNEALREALRYESHSELLDTLTLHFARMPLPDGGGREAVLALPSAHGEEMGFKSASRMIEWNGQPATLWTLSILDTEAGVPSTSVTPTVDRADSASDFTALLDATGDAIAIVDLDGRIVRLNRSGARLFARESGRIAGEDFATLLAPESRGTATALFERVKADPVSDTRPRADCVGRATDGSLFALDMRVVPVDAGRLAIVWRDLSLQRGLERDLAQAQRQLARAGDQQPEFLANLSHQIRTPLNAILGFAQIMMDERFGPLGNPRYKDYLKDMHLSGTQVVAMIDDLMDLSRIETGRLDLRLGAVDINKIIVDCVAEAHGLAHRERIIVRTSFATRLPPVMADERSARQIIGNLLSNAIKFNEPGGQVIVSSASNEASTVVVRIRDTGIGMSDDDIAAALEPFRRLAPTKNASGTGLGLPLTKALVSANGASLSMRSRPNEGTMVEVRFQATLSTPTRVPA